MSDPNANRTGYKETKVGWIPDDWDVSTGANITTLISKGASPKWQGFDYCESGMLFITSENVREGFLDVSAPKFLPLEFNKKVKRSQVKTGDILINLVGASIGRSCKVTEDLGVANVNQAVAVFRLKEPERVGFTALFFQAPDTIRRILEMQVDAARPNISLTDLRDFTVPLPPIGEQGKIGEVISACDEAIEKTGDLIKAKQRQKKALMQQLLTGKKRLPGFEGEWKSVRLGDIFAERAESGREDLPLLAITGNRGIIPASEIDRKDSSSSDKSRYKVIHPGDIGYNTMRMWQGVSAVSGLHGIVSPAYTICRPEPGVDVTFMGYFFKFPPTVYLFWRFSQGLVNDTLNLKFPNFAVIHVTVPEEKEQRAIAAVLQAADEEIAALERKRAVLRKKKKALMQKLLTGQVRVKV